MPLHVLMLFIVSILNEKSIHPGRTLLQKLVYFVLSRLKMPRLHDAHYYGPYSPYVEQSLRDLDSLQLIREESELLPNYTGEEFDVRRYQYTLTEKGKETLKEIVGARTKDFGAIKKYVDSLIDEGGDELPVISNAAKVHYLVKVVGNGARPRPREILEYAAEFGWDLDETEVLDALQFLQATGS